MKPVITFDPALGQLTAVARSCATDGNVLVPGPQRFTWTFDVQFDGAADFTQEVRSVLMTAALNATNGVAMSAGAVVTLTTQPNRYEIDGSVSWLSIDLQVFNLLENGSLPSTPSVVLDAGPLEFIGKLLARYNDPTLPRAPGHPFDLDLVSHQETSAVEIAGTVDGTPVFNFAVARVRYRALATPAAGVRVFFRLFQAPTTSTEFQPASRYATGGMGGTRIPLLGVVNGEIVTIPCFGAARVDPTNANGLHAQTDPFNVGPLGNAIPPDPSGSEVQAYFGCWLDINQNVPVLPSAPASVAGPFTPVQSIQQAIKNKHQCLVAEINLDPPAPQIATGASPALSDKLAQRNLTIVGVASPHLVPQRFELRPTSPRLLPDQVGDELMIVWRDVPPGTHGTIFLPGAAAQDVISAADRLYEHHGLSKADDHTLRCNAAGITYVPIPPGTGRHAGLMTLELPSTMRPGQRFRVVARQVAAAVAVAPGRRPSPEAWERRRRPLRLAASSALAEDHRLLPDHGPGRHPGSAARTGAAPPVGATVDRGAAPPRRPLVPGVPQVPRRPDARGSDGATARRGDERRHLARRRERLLATCLR